MNNSFLKVLLVMASTHLLASKPALYTVQQYEGFSQGELEGVKITADGQLMLGMPNNSVVTFEHSPANLIQQGQDGNLYVATAAKGQLWQINNGKTTIVFESNKPFITSILPIDQTTIAVTTAPNGSVIFVDTKTKKIKRSIQVDEVESILDAKYMNGTIYMVGGGVEGKLLRLREGRQKSETLVTTEDASLQALLLGKHGGEDALYFGSTDKGLVYRYQASKLSVVFNSALEEVKKIAQDEKGNLFIALLSAAGETSPFSTSRAVMPNSEKKKREIKSSELMQIYPDGLVDVLWRSEGEAVFDLALANSTNKIYLATGPNLALYAVSEGGRQKPSLEYRSKEEDDWSALHLSGNELFALGAFDAGVRRFSLTEINSKGSYLSDTAESVLSAVFGKVFVNGKLQPKGVQTYLRVGNTPKPDKTWGPFIKQGEGFQQNPTGRYAQVKLELFKVGSQGPLVDEISGTFLSQNLAPKITSIKVLPPGSLVRMHYMQGSPLHTENLTQTAFDDVMEEGPSWHSNTSGQQAELLYEPGYRSVYVWAEDPDKDSLQYRFSLQALNQAAQEKRLSEWTQKPFVAFDAQALPAGRYRVFVEARDVTENGHRFAESDHSYSDIFVVNHALPIFEKAYAIKAGSGLRVILEVKSSNILNSVACSQKDTWVRANPKDGLVDGKHEIFDIRMQNVDWFSKIACRAEDRAGNKAVVDISVPK